ncbi:MAG: efflux RND transporter permease subunit [Pseudomonadota bacterium]
MQLTDIFIKRPVLACVVSILIFVFGLRALTELTLREYPKMENTVITVTTVYPGANAKLMQGFVTTPIEKVISGADGIDYVTATSSQSTSVIKAYIKLNFPPNEAFTSIMSKVAQVRNQLPQEAEEPVIQKDTGSQIALMYIGFNSNKMSPEQITDYLTRVVQPKLETITGVANAEIFGDSTFAMRVWLKPAKMAALGITPTDVANALRSKNFLSAAGATKGEYVAYNLNAKTDLHDAQQFGNIVVKSVNGSLVRLRNIADVKLGAQNYDSLVTFNGKKAIFIGVTATPTANPLTVISKVRQTLPDLEHNFPPNLHAKIVYDATNYIRASIHEVIRTIAEATVIVIIVIFLFLGSIRSVFIPVITIPLSLIGVCSLMLALGYSINLLTLLAMVLAIGLVVDDAIVVVENIYRHIEDGMSPFQASLKGAKEIALPIIAMTITLAAVYAPIGFMSGITGTLFKEFAFTLAATVIISGVIALTLSPMMCSKLLTATSGEGRFVKFIDKIFDKLKNFYQKRLHNTLNFRPVVVVFAIAVLSSCYFLYDNTQKELAPQEDQSVLFVSANAPEYANIDYVTKFTHEFSKIYAQLTATQDYFVINGAGAVNNVISGLMLKPWNERKLSQAKLNRIVQKKLGQVAGLKTVVFPLPPLPTSGDGLPIEFVVTTTNNEKSLYKVSQAIYNVAMKSGLFLFADNSLKFNRPEIEIHVNRSKAAEMGISMQDIGNALAAAFGGNNINRFSISGRSYEVIPQVLRRYRLNADQINNIYVQTASKQTIPLSTIASISRTVTPNSLTQFDQLNSATIQGLMMPGRTIGDALNFLQQTANKILPKGFTVNYAGQSRQFMQEGNALVYTFFFAILIIFLVLSAQFESFRDPLIILISVPMSICGALIFLNIGLASINIYTQIGLITLIGLISKHGILMVDFANQLQTEEGLTKREAIEKSASIRLRPILMTTAAMVLGVFPLLLASGAGAVSRFDIGLVIASGMLIGTLFTLFVVPTMYTFFAREKNQ